jgi:hypothetical protein
VDSNVIEGIVSVFTEDDDGDIVEVVVHPSSMAVNNKSIKSKFYDLRWHGTVADFSNMGIGLGVTQT